MSISQTLLPEFDTEMKITRRLLERVPSEKGAWKPHEKSFPLGHLTQLVANMPGWITNALTETSLDLATYPGYSYEKTETLLQQFDKHVKQARVAIEKSKDADYEVNWSLKYGDNVILTRSRAVQLRENISHLVHHRGQLTVYLRLIDVPIPMIYGPTADEKMPGF